MIETAGPAVGQLTRRVEVVVNPAAGGLRYGALNRFVNALAAHGVDVDVRLTRRAGHLREIARDLDPDVALLVGGGDGTISEAVAGLLEREGPVPVLGVLPFGSANVLAHELGLPFSPGRLAAMVAKPRLAPLHPGLVGARPFVLMVSAGFDGDVVHAVDAATKHRFGRLAYAAAAIRLALARGGRDVVVEADGEEFVCRLAVVTTAGCYGGPMTLTRATHVTRPGLRLVTLKADDPAALSRAAIGLATRRLGRVSGFEDRDVVSVRFHGAGIRMQVDGDRIDATNAPITASPRLLQVMVP